MNKNENLSPEEQIAFYKIAKEKKVDATTGRCLDKDDNNVANSADAKQKRLLRMCKQAKEQVLIDNENRIQEIPSFADFENESTVEQIEAFQIEMRRRRKEYVYPENKTEDEETRFQKACFSKDDIHILKKLIHMYRTDKFRYSACNLIIEGMKYPQKEIKNLCYQYFKSTMERDRFIDVAVFIRILGKEYVPKGAWRLLLIFRTDFQSVKEILKLLILNHSKDERTRNNWEKIKREGEMVKRFPNENDRDIWEIYCS